MGMLKNHVRRTINFKKEKIKSLTDELQGSYEKVISCYIFFLKIEDKFVNDKIKYKVTVIQVDREVLHIAYIIQNIVYQKK